MEINYELTQQDFQEAVLAHRRRSVGARWTWRIMKVLGILLIALMVIGILSGSAQPREEWLPNFAPFFGAAAVWAALIWAGPWWSARNQFLKQPSAKGARSLALDDAGLHWRWTGGSADIQWMNLIRAHESKHLFLLYSSPACFNIVPKRALSPEGLACFRGLLQQHIAAK